MSRGASWAWRLGAAVDDGAHSKARRRFAADRQVLEALRRSLAVYRMVFGQPPQEDLMEYLLNHVSEQDRAELAQRLTIDPSP